MKTPDEIKKGLSMCTHGADCGHCPYTLLECSHNQMEQDALAYIQQLVRERDAAVADLTEVVMTCGESYCKYCKHEKNPATECVGHCWTHNEGFEWRGVKEE